jgi:hypothetical protein
MNPIPLSGKMARYGSPYAGSTGSYQNDFFVHGFLSSLFFSHSNFK